MRFFNCLIIIFAALACGITPSVEASGNQFDDGDVTYSSLSTSGQSNPIFEEPVHVMRSDSLSPVQVVRNSDLMVLFLSGISDYEVVNYAHETAAMAAIIETLPEQFVRRGGLPIAVITDPSRLSYLSVEHKELFDGLVASVRREEQRFLVMQQEFRNALAVIRKQQLELERLKAGVGLPNGGNNKKNAPEEL